MSALAAPIEVFYSYADADESLCIELDKHLSQLRRDGLITTWHKRQIVAEGGATDRDVRIGLRNGARVSSHLEHGKPLLLVDCFSWLPASAAVQPA